MLITAAMNGSEQAQDIQHNLLEKRLATKQKLCERLEQGVKEGDLSKYAPIATMTDFYCTVIQGLTVQARDGAEIDELNHVVEHAMKAWDLFDQ